MLHRRENFKIWAYHGLNLTAFEAGEYSLLQAFR